MFSVVLPGDVSAGHVEMHEICIIALTELVVVNVRDKGTDSMPPFSPCIFLHLHRGVEQELQLTMALVPLVHALQCVTVSSPTLSSVQTLVSGCAEGRREQAYSS